MNERMERVLQKMEKKGIDQLLVSDPQIGRAHV